MSDETTEMSVGRVIISYGIDADGQETYSVQQTELPPLVVLGLLRYAEHALLDGMQTGLDYYDDEEGDD